MEKIAHCKSCGEPLHKMIEAGTKAWVGSSQCLNHNCKNYGKPQFLKGGL